MKGFYETDRKRWVFMVDDVRHRIKVAELNLPAHQQTKDGSRAAASVELKRRLEAAVIDKYARHPSLSPLVEAVAVGATDEPETLWAHLDEVIQRPEGATRIETAVIREQRKRLERFLDVSLDHVAPDMLEYIFLELPVMKPLKEKRVKAESDRSLTKMIAVYLAERLLSEKRGLKTASTVAADEYSLKHFTDFMGVITVDEIGYDLWKNWGETCESKNMKTWAPNSAKSYLSVSRKFMSWLVQKDDGIAALPKNFKTHKVKTKKKTPKVFTVDELKVMFKKADDALLCYIMLALNTGANQIDIAKMGYAKSADEQYLGWYKNQIRRKRVKEEAYENVPQVRYELWPITRKLIESQKQEGEIVLLNRRGLILVDRGRAATGRKKNNDSIRLAFVKLMKKCGIVGKSFKTLRATSASLLGNNNDYKLFGPLFLDHAPDTVFAVHYLKDDCRVMNEGVKWLASQYPLPK